MGSASRRGTYAERKAAAIARGPKPVVPAPVGGGLLGGHEIRMVEVPLKNGTGGMMKVPQRFKQKPGLYRSADGRTVYRYDGVSVRRATPEEIAFAEGKR